jgi:hypothetical protein
MPDANTLAALDLKLLKLPANPRVIRLDVEDYTDADGDPALRLLAVIDEDTDIDKMSGQDIGDLKMAIQDSLLERGITLFPYVFLAKPSDLVGAVEED